MIFLIPQIDQVPRREASLAGHLTMAIRHGAPALRSTMPAAEYLLRTSSEEVNHG